MQISEGNIPTHCSGRIHVVEALLRIRDLNATFLAPRVAPASREAPALSHPAAAQIISSLIPTLTAPNPDILPRSVPPPQPVVFPTLTVSPGDLSHVARENSVRREYHKMSAKSMGKLFLLVQQNIGLPDNTSRRVLNSFCHSICKVIRFCDTSLDPTEEVIFQHPWVSGWQYALDSLICHTHDSIRDQPST